MERMGYEARPRPRVGAPVAGDAGAPIIGLVPDALAPFAADQIVGAPSSAFSQALFSIAAKLAAPGAVHPPRIILVSGLDRREGHANVAVGLARALAMLKQKVVVIDADFAASAAARTMGLDRARAGLLDVLRGSRPLSRAVARDVRSSALVLAAAAPPANPAALWTARETRQLMDHLRRTSDFVIVDSSWSAETPDIAKLVDAVLLVGTAGSTASLKGAAGVLTGLGVSFVGIVFTR
jgi:receptor protein-tyrosine kinase